MPVDGRCAQPTLRLSRIRTHRPLRCESPLLEPDAKPLSPQPKRQTVHYIRRPIDCRRRREQIQDGDIDAVSRNRRDRHPETLLGKAERTNHKEIKIGGGCQCISEHHHIKGWLSIGNHFWKIGEDTEYQRGEKAQNTKRTAAALKHKAAAPMTPLDESIQAFLPRHS
mgnify:CR=1 FL=1